MADHNNILYYVNTHYYRQRTVPHKILILTQSKSKYRHFNKRTLYLIIVVVAEHLDHSCVLAVVVGSTDCSNRSQLLHYKIRNKIN